MPCDGVARSALRAPSAVPQCRNSADWIAAGRRDLAWQVAEYRQRAFPDYRFPTDVLRTFPALRRPAEPLPENRSEKR